jgi:hypothetical protein
MDAGIVGTQETVVVVVRWRGLMTIVHSSYYGGFAGRQRDVDPGQLHCYDFCHCNGRIMTFGGGEYRRDGGRWLQDQSPHRLSQDEGLPDTATPPQQAKKTTMGRKGRPVCRTRERRPNNNDGNDASE